MKYNYFLMFAFTLSFPLNAFPEPLTCRSANLIFTLYVPLCWVCKKRCELPATQKVDIIPSVWRHVSTPKCHPQAMMQSSSWEANWFAASHEIPPFHGNRRFITALTSLRHLSLFWASPIHSIYPHPTSWRSILILSTHLRLGLPSGLFPSGFSTKTLYAPSPHPYAPHAQPISFFSILSPAQYEEYKSFSSSLCNLLHFPVTSALLGPNIPCHLFKINKINYTQFYLCL